MNYGHVVANRRYRALGVCVACGAAPAVQRHHRDRDSFNNEPGNLAFLCRSCHETIHRRPPPTHCPHGHEYTPENSAVNAQGRRICRACRRIANKASRLRVASRTGSASPAPGTAPG